MNERRSSERIPVTLPVVCELMEDQAGDWSGVDKMMTPIIKDISLGGIKLIGWNFLPEGQMLKVIISSTLISAHLEILGKVAWCNALECDEVCLGVQFINIIHGSQAILQELIQLYCNGSSPLAEMDIWTE